MLFNLKLTEAIQFGICIFAPFQHPATPSKYENASKFVPEPYKTPQSPVNDFKIMESIANH